VKTIATALEASTLQHTMATEMFTRHKRVLLVASIAAVWLAGIAFHDSWLRPWRLILTTCAFVTLAICGVYVLILLKHRVVAGLLSLLTVYCIVPLPSFIRFASVENYANSAVEVRFSSADGKRHKEAKIAPGEHWKFPYFSGDNDGRMAIPCRLEVRNLSSGALASTQVDLPIPKTGPVLRISDEWFLGKVPNH
jgi:hypothetical protein